MLLNYMINWELTRRMRLTDLNRDNEIFRPNIFRDVDDDSEAMTFKFWTFFWSRGTSSFLAELKLLKFNVSWTFKIQLIRFWRTSNIVEVGLMMEFLHHERVIDWTFDNLLREKKSCFLFYISNLGYNLFTCQIPERNNSCPSCNLF